MDAVDDRLSSGQCSMIYLATEEKRIVDIFTERFPGKILVNKRYYLDTVYYEEVERSESKKVLLENVQFNDVDMRYRQGLSYLSSIVLLSTCKEFIAGNCGGSDAALYFNGNKYEFTNIFNLGKY
jgi:hypothetical protein